MKLSSTAPLIMAALLAGGCGATMSRTDPPTPMQSSTPSTPARASPLSDHAARVPALPLLERLLLPKVDAELLPAQASEQLYSFFAREYPVDQVLALFARAYKLNIVVDREVSGVINVEFHDLPFDQAMEAILGSLGYFWERDGALVRVRSEVTRTFTVDYIRLVRSGVSNSEAQVSTGSTGSSTGGSGDASSSEGGTSGGGMSVSQQGAVPFWDELEGQLRALLSATARLVVNRTAGTVMVTDQFRRVQDVGRFLGDVNTAVQRQVDIEVRIVEVALNDDFALGIDWQRLMSEFRDGLNVDFNVSTTVNQPAGGITPAPSVFSLGVFDIAADGALRLSSVIDALKQQGKVKVVSQPHIRTLNNQAGMIKVGTDRTFFRREQTTDTTSAGSTILSSDIPQVVTEGIVLGITPQISSDGWIMIDVYPVITRVSSITQVIGPDGEVQSAAPNLDIRQSTSLVRARSGETIVIGGLIQDLSSDTERAVPGLSSIPGLGRLFKGIYQASGKQELVVFLTPRLITPAAALASGI